MELIDHLRNVPLFAKTKPEYLAMIAGLAKKEHYHSHQELAGQGDLAKRFFIIEAGRVNLLYTDANGIDRSRGVLPSNVAPDSNVPPRDFFGEQMFTSQEPYEYHAIALMDVDAYVFERGDWEAMLKLNPALHHAIPFIKIAEQERTRGFEWVSEGEVVSSIYHKHWWGLLPGLTATLVGAAVALAITLAATTFGLKPLEGVGTVAWVVVALVLAYVVYDWRNDDYIVTNQRVAHVERVILWKELRESMPIDKVQGVSVDRGGLSGMFGVTNVIVRSAGREEGSVTFESIYNGARVLQIIEAQRKRVQARLEAEHRERDRFAIQQALREYILPHAPVPASPQAAAAPPSPQALVQRSTLSSRLAFIVRSMLSLEVRQGSVITWRKHWVVLFKQCSRWFVGLVALDLIFAILAMNPGLQPLSAGGYVLAGLVALLIGLGGLLWEWEDWRNDTYAVTETQIIDAERLPLGIREKSITAPLDQIQDVQVDIPDFLATFLNYGDLKIETAGQGAQMIFHSIPKPRNAADEIFRRIEAHRKNRAEREAESRNKLYIDALVGYDRLKREEARLNPSPPPAPSDSSQDQKPPAESGDSWTTLKSTPPS